MLTIKRESDGDERESNSRPGLESYEGQIDKLTHA